MLAVDGGSEANTASRMMNEWEEGDEAAAMDGVSLYEKVVKVTSIRCEHVMTNHDNRLKRTPRFEIR